MKFIALLAATAASLATVSAMAQSRDKSEDFNGGYIGVVGGKSLQGNDAGSSLVFDTDGDGNFDNIVDDNAGGNAFASGFCNGAALGAATTDCANDKDGAEYFARAGYDRRAGNFVIGGVIEAGRNESVDSVSGYTGTDYYTMSRKAQWNAGARLRAGYTPGGGALFYVTGGGAYARLKNGFTTSNAVNPISDTGKSNAWGWSAGGGAEVMLTSKLSFGLEYLFTDVKDDDYVANIGATTPANLGNILTGTSGVDVGRSDSHFRTHSVRGSLNLRF